MPGTAPNRPDEVGTIVGYLQQQRDGLQYAAYGPRLPG
jgi:hypothetical protein